MWTEVALFLKANSTETLIISIVGAILVWLYKELKTMIDRDQQEKLRLLQLKQGLFTKLELGIAAVLHLQNNESKLQLHALLGECGPYFSTTQRTLVRDYCRTFNPPVLHSLLAMTIAEVDKLGKQMEKLMEYRDNTEWLIFIQRLYAPIWPIVLFVLIILYVAGVFNLTSQVDGSWIKANILVCGLSVFVSATVAVAHLMFLFKKELGKQGWKRWSATLMLVCSPLLFVAFNSFEVAIPVLFVQILMLLYIARSSRPPEIIVP